jgi:Skp family chaperone for outer membrane proteins
VATFEEMQQLSTRVLLAISEAPADVAVIAFVDAAIRVIRYNNPGMGTATACRELARVVEEIGKAEAEQPPPAPI